MVEFIQWDQVGIFISSCFYASPTFCAAKFGLISGRLNPETIPLVIPYELLSSCQFQYFSFHMNEIFSCDSYLIAACYSRISAVKSVYDREFVYLF